ncbi:MAG: 50S ribosomal protein L18e [Candidatus Pacearchaeota archaeon]|nr:50S ribosomal protein L18e [Candidatus Pacearchaeota archaeon]
MVKTSKTKIKRRAAHKTNAELVDLINKLLKQKQPLWQQLAKYLSRPRKKKFSLNIGKLDRLTKEDEVVIVPGKVLGKGELSHRLTIAALKFSNNASKKLEKKADLLSIPELLEKTSEFKGVNIRIIT